jgi:aquaporin Z
MRSEGLPLSFCKKGGLSGWEAKQFHFSECTALIAAALLRHWRLYLDEGVELAIFMISACFFTVWLFNPAWPILHLLSSSALRRLLMGVSMGATAVLIIRSPMGKRSGAHFNPAITLTYFRLGKIDKWDASFYVVSQFIGGILWSGSFSALPAQQPGRSHGGLCGYGSWTGWNSRGFCAEYFMAALLMLVVLWFSNRPPLAQYTSYLVGVLIMFYVFVFAPVSGFSINPARTTGSAVFANVWTAVWLYFVAPVLGMMTSAEIYLRVYGIESVLCAKLHPDPSYPCPFPLSLPTSTVTRMRPTYQSKQISLNPQERSKRKLMPRSV